MNTVLLASGWTRKTHWPLQLFLQVIFFLSCSGGGPPTSSPPPVVAVLVSPESATVQLKAIVSGTSIPTVPWLVNDVPGGSTESGTINSTGLYTAPKVPPSPNTLTVKVVSATDPALSDQASVTFAKPPPAITFLSPSGIKARTEGTTLGVSGSDFTKQLIVQVSGASNPPNFKVGNPGHSKGEPPTSPAIVGAAQLSPKAIGFAPQLLNTISTTETVTLTNTGLASLTINGITVAGANSSDFGMTHNCPGSLAVNSSCHVQVTFRPTAAGPRKSSVSITDSAADSPQTVILTGVGTAIGLSPTSLSFASQTVGSSSVAQTITLTNAGDVTLNLWQIGISGTDAADFSKTTTCGSTLGPGLDCTVSVTFQPTGTGARTASVLFSDDGGGSPQSVNLTATATNPVPSITSLSPSSATAGASAQTLTINGTNFVSNSTVTYNGVDHNATFANSTQMTIGLTAGDQATAGSYPVVVTNPSPGGGTSNASAFTVNNPIPVVTSLSPSSAPLGGAGFTLTVTGSNFVSSSLVRWNGTDLTCTLVSGTQLTAEIPASDLITAGTAQVTVFNPVPGGGTSNASAFTINNPVPALTSLSPSSHTAGGSSFTLTVNGSGFVVGSVVRWSGADRTTTMVSGTQLTVGIAALDLATAGTAQVTVFNPVPGGGISSALPFTIMATGLPVGVHLDVFKVDNGPRVPDAKKGTIGTNISINNDDDNGDSLPDNSNAVIDGAEDRRDMAQLGLNVQPWDRTSGVILLTADNVAAIRIFNNQDQPVTLPETIDPSRFNSGAINYYVEGLAAGAAIVTLQYTEGSSTVQDKVKLVIGQETVIRLTFDDGPEYYDGYTQAILDTLAENNVENNIAAAFFVQTSVEYRGGSPEGAAVLTAENNGGHQVEIHTGSTEDHVDHTIRVLEPPYDVDGDGNPDGLNALESDMIRAKARILEFTGQTPQYVRPPYLDYNDTVLQTYQRVGLTMKLEDVDCGDSDATCQTSVDCINNQLTTQIQSFVDPSTDQQDLIVLFHDIQQITADNLGTFLKAIQDAIQHKGRNVRFSLL